MGLDSTARDIRGRKGTVVGKLEGVNHSLRRDIGAGRLCIEVGSGVSDGSIACMPDGGNPVGRVTSSLQMGHFIRSVRKCLVDLIELMWSH